MHDFERQKWNIFKGSEISRKLKTLLAILYHKLCIANGVLEH